MARAHRGLGNAIVGSVEIGAHHCIVFVDGIAESDSHTMPSRIVYDSTVVEVKAGVLTRHLDH